MLAEIYEEAELPEGLYSVLIGSGSDIGDAYVEHPVPQVISFTGSTEVGARIGELTGRQVKKASLELGGNGPFVVLDDADIDRAVDAAINGKFTHQGQTCMAINRLMVDEAVHDEFAQRFAERAANEEPFGPVAPVILVSGEEEALRVANDTDLGLSSAVFTSDLERGCASPAGWRPA